ncbi:MAG: rod shape-determining protein MreC [Alphaproteobacteria bacterium]|nr:rod shape-determining protein MreC [Alphaproteobacteria bacterium]
MAWDRRRRRGSDSGPWAFLAHNLSLALFVVLALGILIAARVQDNMFERAREAFNDAGAPVMEALTGPAVEVKRWSDGVGSLFAVYKENQRLREENERLLAAQSELAYLQRKVQRYEELLKAPAEADVTSVAARIIADAGGPFVHTVLINAGRAQGVTKGQAVVDERGLLGRVVASGNHSARVLLLSDLNSRIPVMVEGANLKAILAGDNSGRPALEYLPPGSRITAGSRVVTTPDGGVFPPGIAVGKVASGSQMPRVELYTAEGRADFVRVLHYTAPVDVDDAEPEPMPGAKTDPAKGKAGAAPVAPAAATPPQAAVPSAGGTLAAARQPT